MSLVQLSQIGKVDHACNKQLCYAVLRLELELREVHTQIKNCIEYGMDAFLDHFRSQGERLIMEITLMICSLRSNVHALTQ